MAHGAEDGRLDSVAGAQALCRQGLALELLAVEADGKKRGERGEEAAHRGRWFGRSASGTSELPDETRSGQQLDPLAPLRAPSSMLRAFDSEDGSGRAPDPGELVDEAFTLKQGDRELSEQGLLPLALLRLGGALTRPRGELADGDRGGQVDGRASQFERSDRRNVCTGSRKKKLNASMLAMATSTAQKRPQRIATGRTAST